LKEIRCVQHLHHYLQVLAGQKMKLSFVIISLLAVLLGVVQGNFDLNGDIKRDEQGKGM
jgi:hypothetical protein